MKSRFASYPLIFYLVLLAFSVIVECETLTSRRHQRREQLARESGPERYKKAFSIIQAILLLAVAPVLIRFIHCLLTDPVVPIVLKELFRRAKKMASEKFGNLGMLGDEESDEDSMRRHNHIY